MFLSGMLYVQMLYIHYVEVIITNIICMYIVLGIPAPDNLGKSILLFAAVELSGSGSRIDCGYMLDDVVWHVIDVVDIVCFISTLYYIVFYILL